MRLSRGTARLAAGVGIAVLLGLAGGCADDPLIVTGGGVVSSSGGTVDVECLGRYKVRIVGSSPAPGFTARVIVAGPSSQASLMFEHPGANDFRVAVHCRDATPQVREWEVEDTTVS